MDKKKQERELEKLRDQKYADEYNKKVTQDFSKHESDINNLRNKNAKLLDSQFNTVIEDANNDKKRAAVENMRKTYERELQEQMEAERKKAEDKKLELKETQRILQLQMNSKHLN